MLKNIKNNEENLHSSNNDIVNKINFNTKIKEHIFNEFENGSKKSLSEKIISIINSSGTIDDYDLSENGKI